MFRRPLLRQLEIGMSMSRYFPATGTAGLARSLVSGNSRLPRPPPRIKLSMWGWEGMMALAMFGTDVGEFVISLHFGKGNGENDSIKLPA